MTGRSVLVIDDDPIFLAIVRRRLTRSGWTVHAAGDATEGLERFADQTPDAVVVDLWLTDTDGVDIIRRIRAVGAAATFSVFLASAVEPPPAILSQLDAVDAEFLSKDDLADAFAFSQRFETKAGLAIPED